jgi:hypothetical protein
MAGPQATEASFTCIVKGPARSVRIESSRQRHAAVRLDGTRRVLRGRPPSEENPGAPRARIVVRRCLSVFPWPYPRTDCCCWKTDILSFLQPRSCHSPVVPLSVTFRDDDTTFVCYRQGSAPSCRYGSIRERGVYRRAACLHRSGYRIERTGVESSAQILSYAHETGPQRRMFRVTRLHRELRRCKVGSS